MVNDELSKTEKETMERFINETKAKLRKHKVGLIIKASIFFIPIACMTYTHWMNPDITRLTSILIGGQFYAIMGAIFTILGALSKTSTITLMSTTRWNGNPTLFYELMKSRETTIMGLSFIGLGFLMQALGMLLIST